MVIPPIHGLVAGFPCTTASGLNKFSNSEANLSAVETASGATGECFKQIVDSLIAQQKEQHALSLVVLENVPRLARTGRSGHSSLDHVVHELERQLGFQTVVWKLNAKDFGSCQSRERLWMIALPKTEADPTHESQLQTQMHEWMCRLSGIEQTPFDEMLLPETDEFVVRAVRQAHVRRAREHNPVGVKRKQKSKRGRGWVDTHKLMFNRKGLQWRAAPFLEEEALKANPGLAMLCERQAEVLQYAGVTASPERRQEHRVFEVSQDLIRMKGRHTADSIGTIIPRGVWYLTRRARCLVAVEMLNLQGLYFNKEVLRETSDNLLRDLAGNAFEAGCHLLTTQAHQ